MQPVSDALRKDMPGSHSVMSGLIAACRADGQLQPTHAACSTWQLYQQAVHLELTLDHAAQQALWQTQSGGLQALHCCIRRLHHTAASDSCIRQLHQTAASEGASCAGMIHMYSIYSSVCLWVSLLGPSCLGRTGK